jgi:hypothetical protein
MGLLIGLIQILDRFIGHDNFCTDVFKDIINYHTVFVGTPILLVSACTDHKIYYLNSKR